MDSLRLRKQSTVPDLSASAESVSLYLDDESVLNTVEADGTVTPVGTGVGADPLPEWWTVYIDQPAAPQSLGEIIQVLKDLGFVAAGPNFSDNFNRADGDPGVNWFTPWITTTDGAGVEIVSGALTADDEGWGATRTVATFAADRSVEFTISAGANFSCIIQRGPSGNDTTLGGDMYMLSLTADPYFPIIRRCNDVSIPVIYTGTADMATHFTPTADQRYRISVTTVTNNTVLLWERYSASTWVTIVEYTHSSAPMTGVGYVGFEIVQGTTISDVAITEL